MPAAIPFVIAAGQAYAAATAATALAAGLYATAAAFTTIGALAKNEKLTMLGGLLSVGAGVAGMAGANAAATPADAARAAEGGATEPVASAAEPAADTAAAELASPAVETAASSASLEVPEGAIGGQLGREGVLQSAMAPAAAETAQGTGTGLIAEQAGMTPTTAGSSPIATWSDVRGPAGWGTPSASAPAPGAGGFWPELKQSIGGLGDWINQNPAQAKLGGGLIQGAMKYYGDQQIADDNLKRQQRYQDWVRQRYSDSVRNLQVPAVTLTAPQSSGIIGGQRG